MSMPSADIKADVSTAGTASAVANASASNLASADQLASGPERRARLAARVWNIPHIQRAIVLHTENRTRARLLRVSRGLFNSLAWALWGDLDGRELTRYLEVASPAHNIVYSRGVHSIDTSGHPSFVELFMRFPNLCGLNDRRDSEGARVTWRRSTADPYEIETDSMCIRFLSYLPSPSWHRSFLDLVESGLLPAGNVARYFHYDVSNGAPPETAEQGMGLRRGCDGYSLSLKTSDLSHCELWIDTIIPAEAEEIDSIDVKLLGWPKEDVVACFGTMLKATSTSRVKYDRDTLAALDPLDVLKLAVDQGDCLRQLRSLHLKFQCAFLDCTLEEALVDIGLSPRGVGVDAKQGRRSASRNLASFEITISDYVCPQQLVNTWIPLLAEAMFHIGGPRCAYDLHFVEKSYRAVPQLSQAPVSAALYRKMMEEIVQDYYGRGEAGWRKLEKEEWVPVPATAAQGDGET